MRKFQKLKLSFPFKKQSLKIMSEQQVTQTLEDSTKSNIYLLYTARTSMLNTPLNL